MFRFLLVSPFLVARVSSARPFTFHHAPLHLRACVCKAAPMGDARGGLQGTGFRCGIPPRPSAGAPAFQRRSRSFFPPSQPHCGLQCSLITSSSHFHPFSARHFTARSYLMCLHRQCLAFSPLPSLLAFCRSLHFPLLSSLTRITPSPSDRLLYLPLLIRRAPSMHASLVPVCPQRALAHALCRAASSSKEGHSCHQVVQQLLQPLLASLHAITSAPDFAATAHRPQVMFQVIGVLECMRGCASATLPHSQRVLFQFGLSAGTPILTALSAYRHEPQVVFVVLKFMAVWVDSQILFLTPDDTAQLFHLCLQLLEAYAAHNMGKVSLQRSRQLSEGVRESKYKDLKALLQLLSSLTSKDLLDFGASLPGQSADVAQMVCLGVNIIIPLISLDLLQFPKLCLQYFTLLEHMCCVHPEKVLALPDSAFHPIMHTLEFGLQHQDEEILVLSLSSVSSLASPTSSSSSSSASLAPEHVQRHQALVAHLLRLVLQLVLLQPLRNETVEAAADALLPLILACPQLTQTILSEAVSSHVDPAGQLHLSSAVSTFLAAASAAAAASASATSAAAARPVRRRFRSALAAFIADVQGLIVRRCAAMVSTLLNSQTPPFLSSPPLCSNAVVVATRETTAAAAAADDERLGARAAAGRCLGQRLGAAATEQHGAARRRGAAGRAGECHSGRRRSVVRAMGCLQGSRELS
ncbi:unnamed protein product [Closterium sp. NIES-53]